MRKKKRKRKTGRQATPSPSPLSEAVTLMFREEIRKSPLWAEMVAEFGAEKAEQLLIECRLDVH
jgi:hypothetical protein